MASDSSTKAWWTGSDLRREARLGPKAAARLVKDGVVTSPGRGPNAGWDLEGRIRFLAAVKLGRRGYRGQALKEKVESSTSAQLRALAGLPAVDEAPKALVVPAIDPKAPSTWLRVPVAPGVELHVDLSRADSSKVAAMVKSLGG